MGQLVMEFHGLCLHLDRAGVPLLGIVHRVVATNASSGYDSRLFGRLPAHHAFLTMDNFLLEHFVRAGMSRDEKGNILLTGARVEVVNAADEWFTADIELIPQLRTYTPQMKLRTELADKVLPETGDSFVETKQGTIKALQFNPGGGFYSRWIVETVGDPEIRITQRDGQACLVPVPSNSNDNPIVLKNGTTDKSDEKLDFALHYLAACGGIDEQYYAKKFPTDSGIDRSIGVDTTTSCSNSQYP